MSLHERYTETFPTCWNFYRPLSCHPLPKWDISAIELQMRVMYFQQGWMHGKLQEFATSQLLILTQSSWITTVIIVQMVECYGFGGSSVLTIWWSDGVWRFSIPSPAGKWGNEEEETTHTPPPPSQGLCDSADCGRPRQVVGGVGWIGRYGGVLRHLWAHYLCTIAPPSPPSFTAHWVDVDADSVGLASDNATAYWSLRLRKSGTAPPGVGRRKGRVAALQCWLLRWQASMRRDHPRHPNIRMHNRTGHQRLLASGACLRSPIWIFRGANNTRVKLKPKTMVQVRESVQWQKFNFFAKKRWGTSD